MFKVFSSFSANVMSLSGNNNSLSYLIYSKPPLDALKEVDAEALEVKKEIVQNWLRQGKDINDAIGEDGQVYFINWAIEQNDCAFATYLSGLGASVPSSVEVNHFMTLDMRRALGIAEQANSAFNEATSPLWQENEAAIMREMIKIIARNEGFPEKTNSILRNEYMLSLPGEPLVTRKVIENIPIVVGANDRNSMVLSIHKAALWLADKPEVQRPALFNIIVKNSMLASNVWYEAIRKALLLYLKPVLAVSYYFANVQSTKELTLSYVAILNEVKEFLSPEECYWVLQTMNKAGMCSASSGFFYNSVYQQLCLNEPRFCSAISQLRLALDRGYSPSPMLYSHPAPTNSFQST